LKKCYVETEKAFNKLQQLPLEIAAFVVEVFKCEFQVVLHFQVQKQSRRNAIMTLGKLNQTITTFNYLIKLQNYAAVAKS